MNDDPMGILGSRLEVTVSLGGRAVRWAVGRGTFGRAFVERFCGQAGRKPGNHFPPDFVSGTSTFVRFHLKQQRAPAQSQRA